MRGQTRDSLTPFRSFKFVFILHLMNEVLGINDSLEDVECAKNLLSSLRLDG